MYFAPLRGSVVKYCALFYVCVLLVCYVIFYVWKYISLHALSVRRMQICVSWMWKQTLQHFKPPKQRKCRVTGGASYNVCVYVCMCVDLYVKDLSVYTHTHVIHRWSTWLYSKMPFLCFVFWLYNELVLLQKSATFMFYEFIFFISYPFFTLLCMREFQFVCTIISCVWLTVFAVYLGFVWRSLLATVSRGTCNNVRFIVL